MNGYIQAGEIAELWKISMRQVQTLCKEERSSLLHSPTVKRIRDHTS